MRSFILALVALAFSTLTAQAESRVQRVITPGGIEAWLVEENAIPMIAAQISFAGGARLDPEGEEGASTFAAALIEEGAGPYDSAGFAARLDELSGRLSFSASRDGFGVGLRTLTENAEDTFALLRVALSDPHFEEDDIERVRGQFQSNLRRQQNDPQSLAGRRWYAEMLAGSAYARPAGGTLESMTAMTREQITQAYGRLVAKNRMKIGVVGDIDAETLGALLDSTFGALPDGPELETAEFPIREEGGLVVVREEVPQSSIIFGHRGILRDDADFIPAFVMNHALGGGGLSSRLTEVVREKNGLAYGVYSYLNPADRAGLYMGGLATANESVGKALSLVKAEWVRMAENGLDADELERVKRYLTGAYALRFDSNQKIANMLVGLQEAGLPIDYPETRNAMVEAVTVEDIQRVAKRLLKPDQLFVVVSGDPVDLDE